MYLSQPPSGGIYLYAPRLLLHSLWKQKEEALIADINLGIIRVQADMGSIRPPKGTEYTTVVEKIRTYE